MTARELTAARRAVAGAHTIVVKIGSSSLTSLGGGLDLHRLSFIADAIEARMQAGSDVVIVSSGAVSAGLAPLGLNSRPRDLATKQAAASVGQLALADAWGRAFRKHGRTVAQVLLTADDLARRVRHRNAQRTLDRLRALHAVAVVNENDVVATNELRFGDNDRLAALVAALTSADALFLLSDVDGLYDADPRKGPANLVAEVDGSGDLEGVQAGGGGMLGTGGMASKLRAARLASGAGVPVLLAAADQADIALSSATVGTVFAAGPERLSSRRFWVRYAAAEQGALHLDAGAVDAVAHRRRSLLAAGITAVEGDFLAGAVVALEDPSGNTVARGVVAYDSAEVAEMVGHSTDELPDELHRPVVHADDLVPL